MLRAYKNINLKQNIEVNRGFINDFSIKKRIFNKSTEF